MQDHPETSGPNSSAGNLGITAVRPLCPLTPGADSSLFDRIGANGPAVQEPAAVGQNNSPESTPILPNDRPEMQAQPGPSAPTLS